MTISAITVRTQEPLILRGSTPADREARAQQLATMFVKFVGEMVPLLIQVRQDFWDKGRDELIYNCRTFTEYCAQVLRYSDSHIRRLIAGHNPATKKFDGSANRKVETVEDTRTCVERLHDSDFFEKCRKYDPALLGLHIAQAMCIDEDDLCGAATLEGKIVTHIWKEAERRREQEEQGDNT